MFENPEEKASETGGEAECAVCCAAHDDEIHEATLSIHRWFNQQVRHIFEDDALYLPYLNSKLAGT